MTTVKVLGLVLLVGGLLLWISYAFPSLPRGGLLVVSPLEAPPAPERTTLTGAVIMNARVDPHVPYIEYHTEGGSVRTKQLIFRNSRGCAPSAGDLPCAPGFGPSAPPVSYGQRIQVTGIIIGDQILVESMDTW